eukprot:10774307-Ditylum_brightwellii.AAC.1
MWGWVVSHIDFPCHPAVDVMQLKALQFFTGELMHLFVGHIVKVSHHFDENLVVLLGLGGFCDVTALYWRSLTYTLK